RGRGSRRDRRRAVRGRGRDRRARLKARWRPRLETRRGADGGRALFQRVGRGRQAPWTCPFLVFERRLAAFLHIGLVMWNFMAAASRLGGSSGWGAGGVSPSRRQRPPRRTQNRERFGRR